MIDFTIFTIFITLILGYFTWCYDRGRRYNYLAERWYKLMNTNIDCPEFFDSNETKDYMNFNDSHKTKYQQHARMYWAFVEDIIFNNYYFEKLPFVLSFVDLYDKTIKNIFDLHLVWLKDNQKLFNNKKFINVLRKYSSSEGEIEKIFEHQPDTPDKA